MRWFERARRTLAARIALVFLPLILLFTTASVLAMRHLIRRDLEGRTRLEMIESIRHLEGRLRELRTELSFFARLAARAGQAFDDPGSTAYQIALIDEARLRGIELEEFVAREGGVSGWTVLERGFAGMDTVDYILSEEGRPRVLLVAVSPMTPRGRDRKAVAASVALDRSFLRRQREEGGGDFTILSKAGVVASSSTCEECLRCLEEIVRDPVQWNLLHKGNLVYSSFECRPEPQTAILSPVRTFDGQTVVLAKIRSRIGQVAAMRRETLVVLGGAVGVAGALAAAFFLLTARVVRPLKELTRIAGRISEGMYGETVPEEGEDEVGELSRAFNRMSGSLRKADEEISAWSREIESRVEEKTLELEKFHRRMMEVEKLAALGQLAAGVAHELNNPLTGILGYAEMAKDRDRAAPPKDPEDPERERMVSYFHRIEELANRCRGIILDMLTFARRHTEEPRDTEINELIHQTLGFLDVQLARRKVLVVRDFQEGLPVLRGNPLQLQQVFTNLILNAAHAMPGGGTLTIRTRQEEGTVRAEFEDTGTGIDPANRHRLFEPFFTTKPPGEGTGLGLSVSYGIVQKHGGTIAVSSEPGHGALFTVVLPLAPPE